MRRIGFRIIVLFVVVELFATTYSQDCIPKDEKPSMTAVENPVFSSHENKDDIFLEVEVKYDADSTRVEVKDSQYPSNTTQPSVCTSCICSYVINSVNYNTTWTNFTFFVRNKTSWDILDSTIITLILEDATKIIGFSPIVYKEEKDPIFNIQCAASGNPSPRIAWDWTNVDGKENLRQLDQEFPDAILISDITATRNLTLKQNKEIKFENSGTYTCEAMNSINNNKGIHQQSEVMELIVHVPAQIWNKSDDIHYTGDNPRNLTCTFRAFPSPNETFWQYNSSRRYIELPAVSDGIFTTTYLQMTSINCEDEGIFKCVATNYILENGEERRGEDAIKIIFPAPPNITTIETSSPECNGSMITTNWDYPDSSETTIYEVVLHLGPNCSFSTSTQQKSITLPAIPATTYTIEVIAVGYCNKTSDPVVASGTTGIVVPSDPTHVSMSMDIDAQNCIVIWKEEDLAFNNSYQVRRNINLFLHFSSVNLEFLFEIEYNVENLATHITELESKNTVSRMYVIDTKPNSNYSVRVSARNCAGQSSKVTAMGNCFSDSAAVEVVPELVISNETDEVPHIDGRDMFEVDIPIISEENGIISCYYIVMEMYDKVYQDIENVNRVHINASDLSSIADADEENVTTRQLYFAVAVTSPGTVVIGDGNVTSCDNNDTTLTEKGSSYGNGIQAKSRKLTFDRSYDMFLLTIVPSLDDPDKTYNKANQGTFFNVLSVPLSSSTAFSTRKTNSFSSTSSLYEMTTGVSSANVEQNLVQILVPIFVVLVLISVGVGYWFYRNYRKNKPDKGGSDKPFEMEETRKNDSESVIEEQGRNGKEPSTSTTPMLAPTPKEQQKRKAQVVVYQNVSFKNDDENISTFIPTKKIYEKYKDRSKNNNTGFSEEFNFLPLEFAQPRAESLQPENRKKNRYTNIYPYDEARVVLPRIPDVENSDYINACYINGYSSKCKFIAAQGPLEKTVGDFWRMIYHYKCYSIVMVTGLIENARVKCSQYWPTTPNSPKTYGMLQVILKEETLMIDYVIRKFEVLKESETRRSQKRFVVTQYHFIGWPDHGVPQSATGILRLHRLVMRENPTNSGPIVVHCSAGVGRTGTFIALDILFEQMVKENGVDFVKTITDLRKQRPKMVQVLDQYIFVYRAIADIAKYGNTEFEVSQIDYEVNELQKFKENNRIDGFGEQYAKLRDIEIIDRRIKAATLSVNKKRNRTAAIVPYDRNRAYILDRKSGEMIYINASIVKGYRRKDAFITTQAPLEHTAAEFWKMILEYGSRIIVTLNAFDDTEKFKENPFQYWPDHNSTLELGDFLISCHKENVSGSFVTRDLNVKKTSDPNATGMDVTQYHFLSWKPKLAPNDGQGLLDMIAEIGRIQQNTTQNEAPIVVQCSDGSGRSGAFCAIMTLIETAKTEGIVDVFRTIRDLRQERTGMVDSPELFRFCYEILQVYVNSFGLYSNFK